MRSTSTRHEHAMVRLEIETDQMLSDFRAAFERAAPVPDYARLRELGDAGATWDAISTEVSGQAPHGLLRFATLDLAPLLAAAGHDGGAVEYLLGNHVIAEQMFRHQPVTALYAPLRVLVYADPDGRAIFAVDQPSTVFAGLDDSRVMPVAHELDRILGRFLTALGVAPPTELSAAADAASEPSASPR